MGLEALPLININSYCNNYQYLHNQILLKCYGMKVNRMVGPMFTELHTSSSTLNGQGYRNINGYITTTDVNYNIHLNEKHIFKSSCNNNNKNQGLVTKY